VTDDRGTAATASRMAATVSTATARMSATPATAWAETWTVAAAGRRGRDRPSAGPNAHSANVAVATAGTATIAATGAATTTAARVPANLRRDAAGAAAAKATDSPTAAGW